MLAKLFIMKRLTDKQSQIYDFIVTSQSKNGYPPTHEELREYFGFNSLNSVRNHLLLIEKKGYIQLNHGKARGIHLSLAATYAPQKDKESIPLLGNIAAGVPIWAEQNFEESLPILPALFGKGELFALRVVGDSMTGAGINHGDIAVIQKRDHVESGEIAAVLIENEATLKRVFLLSDSLVLKSENPEYKDLKYEQRNRDSIYILGHFKGIVRTVTNWYSA